MIDTMGSLGVFSESAEYAIRIENSVTLQPNSVVGSSPVSREALSVIYPEGVEQQSPGSAALPRHPGNGVAAIERTLKGFHNTKAREFSVD